ncbi:MAG: hypothetical protein FJ313_00795 [Gemmatimonadetes bacterium]|nr:hypothetical protein [Gemmatimonadota bacterium]
MAEARAPGSVLNTYTGLVELKQLAAISGSDGDPALWMALEAASRAVDRFCNRHFYVLSCTRTFDVEDAAGFGVPDLVSVTALREDADRDRVFEVTRSAADYLLYPLNADPTAPWGRPYGRVVADPAGPRPEFTVGRRAVEIAGEWGYRRHTADTGADLNEGGALPAEATTVTITDGTLVAAGQTLLLGGEQVFVREVSGNNLTVTRGVNGTTAAEHADGLDVLVYRYPEAVARAVLLMAGRFWKRKDSPYGPTAGAQGFGPIEVVPGTDPDAWALLSSFRRLPVGAVVA